jgi:A/G-specific adenine glycosylase
MRKNNMTYDYKEIVPYLLHWFDYNARILSWRENPKPYYIWISEIMLQQTRVEAVKGYFDRFITAIPDINALANAEEEKLLKLWEGLGYYNRVRNLQKAAILICDQYGGEMPASYEQLLSLPGVGEYTAGAIASIAFGLPVPAVDGNVLRVMKRIAGSFDDITKAAVKKALWEDINAVIPKDRPGDFNQSLMELGATVCLPNGKPLCDQCPVMHLCKAFHEETFLQIPVKPDKKERRREERTILLMEFEDRVAIRKRREKGLLSGLWELPGLEEKLTPVRMTEYLKEQNIKAMKLLPLGEAKHIFSHVEWHMIGYQLILSELPESYSTLHDIRWIRPQEIMESYSIPNAFSAFTKQIMEKK